MAQGQPITLRLTIDNPVPGMAYSLCNKKNQSVGTKVAGGAALSFDIPVRVAEGGRFLGEFVRTEGPVRRFVYISIGAYAGDPASPCNGRMKINVHDIPAPLVEAAVGGAVLETVLAGRGKTGGPTYATVVKSPWRLV